MDLNYINQILPTSKSWGQENWEMCSWYNHQGHLIAATSLWRDRDLGRRPVICLAIPTSTARLPTCPRQWSGSRDKEAAGHISDQRLDQSHPLPRPLLQRLTGCHIPCAPCRYWSRHHCRMHRRSPQCKGSCTHVEPAAPVWSGSGLQVWSPGELAGKRKVEGREALKIYGWMMDGWMDG